MRLGRKKKSLICNCLNHTVLVKIVAVLYFSTLYTRQDGNENLGFDWVASPINRRMGRNFYAHLHITPSKVHTLKELGISNIVEN